MEFIFAKLICEFPQIRCICDIKRLAEQYELIVGT